MSTKNNISLTSKSNIIVADQDVYILQESGYTHRVDGLHESTVHLCPEINAIFLIST